jgi:hypothetical protein
MEMTAAGRPSQNGIRPVLEAPAVAGLTLAPSALIGGREKAKLISDASMSEAL